MVVSGRRGPRKRFGKPLCDVRVMGTWELFSWGQVLGTACTSWLSRLATRLQLKGRDRTLSVLAYSTSVSAACGDKDGQAGDVQLEHAVVEETDTASRRSWRIRL